MQCLSNCKLTWLAGWQARLIVIRSSQMSLSVICKLPLDVHLSLRVSMCVCVCLTFPL